MAPADFRRRPRRALIAALMMVGLAMPAAEARAQPMAPEPATGRTADRGAATARDFMVSTAHPLAAEAAMQVLGTGGSAADAAIAAQLVLNLVEPQSSGIGGGAFLLHYESETEILIAFDGRETAPAAATPDLFLNADGEPLGFQEAVVGGRSVGTPGLMRLIEAVHTQQGVLPWPRLFEPAIALAEGGFPVSPRLAAMLDGEPAERLRTQPAARDYFFPGGQPVRTGDTLRNPAFAATLRTIAAEGADAFYTGPIGQDIVAAVQGAVDNPGRLTLADLAGYRVVERDPICLRYRRHRVCGMGPPSSGQLTIGQILGILEHFDLPGLGPDSALAWHLFADASKLAFADRALYMADADAVRMPTAGLLDRTYLTLRAQMITRDRALATPAPAGNPPWRETRDYAPDASLELPGTTHISVIDAAGNAVSMTSTIENAFGSMVMVRGFLLNNQLTDFSFRPSEQGRPVANRVEPGKRPRSSMAPTMVFDADDRLSLVIGSPGGSRIIPYVAQTLIAVLDWGLDVQAAIELPHVANRNGGTDLEAGTAAADFADALTALGHTVTLVDLNSGLHGIQVLPDGTYLGGADPRREGIALGQ